MWFFFLNHCPSSPSNKRNTVVKNQDWMVKTHGIVVILWWKDLGDHHVPSVCTCTGAEALLMVSCSLVRKLSGDLNLLRFR